MTNFKVTILQLATHCGFPLGDTVALVMEP